MIKSITNSAQISDNSYSWTIPEDIIPGIDYSVRITSNTDSSVRDTSDGYFAFGTIIVKAPNGGEVWYVGATSDNPLGTYAISWTYTGNVGASVKLELLDSCACGTPYLITDSTPIGSNGQGSYPWAIPSDPWLAPASGNYILRITSNDNSQFSDTSDSHFTISEPPTPPKITITSPIGGETWWAGYGSTGTIKWSSTGDIGPDVKIELLKGVLDQIITPSTSASSGSYTWVVTPTQPPETDYQIRVTSNANPIYTDIGGYFTISKLVPV
jgi:hypothetical protein